jgi:hypothetical protein
MNLKNTRIETTKKENNKESRDGKNDAILKTERDYHHIYASIAAIAGLLPILSLSPSKF